MSVSNYAKTGFIELPAPARRGDLLSDHRTSEVTCPSLSPPICEPKCHESISGAYYCSLT